MTTIKRGPYFYLLLVLSIIGFPFAIFALFALKIQILNELFWSDYQSTSANVFSILSEFYWVSEMFKHYAGYTVVKTTKYKIFKCRESGTDSKNEFIMFADNTDELDLYFDFVKPGAKFFYEEAEMNGKSIEMKLFNNK